MGNRVGRGGVTPWVRGAQTTVHEISMFFQSLGSILTIGTFLTLAVIGWVAFTSVDSHERYLAYKSVVATVYEAATGSEQTKLTVNYTTRTGDRLAVLPQDLNRHPSTKAVWKEIRGGAIKGAVMSVPAFIGVIVLVGGVFQRAGSRTTEDEYLRGASLTKNRTKLQKELVKQKPMGPTSIAGIRVPASYKTAHDMYVGGPGSGKTQLILEKLSGLRKAGRRAILYDVNGTYVEAFYRPGIDTILNPLDERTALWNIFDEIRHDADFEHFANVVIPEDDGENSFWSKAGSILFASVLRKLFEENEKPTTADLLHVLQRMPMEEVGEFIAGTDAASIVDPGAEKMALSVRATVTANMSGFRFLDDDARGFSIKDYVLDDESDGWLFITSKNDQIEALKYLITLWVDIAVGQILSLPADQDRRIHFVFDELTSLSRLPSLQIAMAQSRKHGGCVTLGYQSIEQLYDTYGEKQGEAITGNCATWMLLRANDAATAKWASEAIGDTEKAETSEGLAISKSEIGDRRTMNRQVQSRPTVMKAELRNLPNLKGYLVFGRGHPVLETKFPYTSYPSLEPAFVPSEPRSKRLSERARSRGPGPILRPRDGIAGLPDIPLTAGDDLHIDAVCAEAERSRVIFTRVEADGPTEALGTTSEGVTEGPEMGVPDRLIDGAQGGPVALEATPQRRGVSKGEPAVDERTRSAAEAIFAAQEGEEVLPAKPAAEAHKRAVLEAAAAAADPEKKTGTRNTRSRSPAAKAKAKRRAANEPTLPFEPSTATEQPPEANDV